MLWSETRTTGGQLGRVVLVHGFTQTSQSWSSLADALAGEGFEVVLVDAPGHGRSRDVRVDLWEAGAALLEVGGDATYVGYSMGARMALHAALLPTERVRALVLLGATAGIDDPGEREDRRRHDEALAVSLETDGLEAFLIRWMASPLFATLSPQAAGRESRLTNSIEGLASSLRLCGTGTQDPPLWDRLGALARPTLVLAGELDPKFATLAHRLAGAIGRSASVVLIPGAGHTAHLEQPTRFLAVLRQFLVGNPSP